MQYVIQPKKSKKTILLTALLSIVSISFISPPKAEAVTLNSIMNSLRGDNQRDKTGTLKDDTNEQSAVTPILPLQTPVVPETPTNSVTPVLPATPTLPVAPETPAQTAPIPVVTPPAASPVMSIPVTLADNAPQSHQGAVQPQVAGTTPTAQPAVAQSSVAQQTVVQPAAAQPTEAVASTVQNTLTASALDTSAAVLSTANSQSATKSSIDGTPYVSNKINPELAQYLLFTGVATMTAGTLMYGAGLIPAKKHVRHIPVKIL